jgi:hypothetical protein
VKDIERGGTSTATSQQQNSRRPKKRTRLECSVCTSHIWFDAIPLVEPEGVPEPRRSWTLCKSCHRALLTEMRRSPIRSPLRLRIAMGLVAAERAPLAYPRSNSYMNDKRWIVVLAWGFGIAMVLHLVLIVMIASIAR